MMIQLNCWLVLESRYATTGEKIVKLCQSAEFAEDQLKKQSSGFIYMHLYDERDTFVA